MHRETLKRAASPALPSSEPMRARAEPAGASLPFTRPRPAGPPAPQIEGAAAGHSRHKAITQTEHGAERPAQGLRACILVHVITGLPFLPLLAPFFGG